MTTIAWTTHGHHSHALDETGTRTLCGREDVYHQGEEVDKRAVTCGKCREVMDG